MRDGSSSPFKRAAQYFRRSQTTPRASGCMRSLSNTRTLEVGTGVPACIATALAASSLHHCVKALLCARGHTCSMLVTLNVCKGLRKDCKPSRTGSQAEDGVCDFEAVGMNKSGKASLEATSVATRMLKVTLLQGAV